MLVKLIRTIQNDKMTIGNLFVADEFSCNTLELPWKDNQPFISCIPPGTYTCSKVLSKRHGTTFQIDDVPGRDGILFHVGNFPKDTEGCILLGRHIGNDRDMIYNSGTAFNEFTATLWKVDKFTLEIS